MPMSLPRKIAALLIALEAGYELKVESGHTIVMADEHDEPGFLTKMCTFNTKTEENTLGDTRDMIMMIGDDVTYMAIVNHAKRITDADIESIEKSFRT